ncbi:hypothetical protein Thexy_0703 [Thermoanaerobacterium xylanolyticum LX-11]|uniref:Uncharacterized protein n=1 Tax=Thermoanaerobacterium xylanolyticum (strain ATCC 49914 / DSM 7097 / LX-11) TaxID=858215 RepID=F6BIE2_THEXL|nr:hypothetical protein [Thermoanaerobacterium xylanolyticum]AEF16750.1 hypothetical protein Thexy_0703 [Thermoanaerobacterium xylanolyticum LX-11]
MDKEKLLKVLIIELFIIFFIRFQIFDGLSIEGERQLLKKKEGEEIVEHDKDDKTESKKNDEKKSDLDIFEIIEKSKNFMGSVKPYLHRKEQYYIDIFTKIAEILECHKQLMEFNQEAEMQEDDFDQIGMLKAVKPYMKEDKQMIIDKFIKLHEGIQNLNEKMKKYEVEGDKNNIIDKILDIFEAIKPVIPDDKKDMAEKIIKNIKLVEALNNAESIMNSKNSESRHEKVEESDRSDVKNNLFDRSEENKKTEEVKDAEDAVNDEMVEGVKSNDVEREIKKDDVPKNLGLTDQQSEVVNGLKSMLTKEQQQFMYNMINYLKQQSSNGNVNNVAGD